jgi:hypothetical protein
MNTEAALTEFEEVNTESSNTEFNIFDEIDPAPIVRMLHRILIYENAYLEDVNIDDRE